MTIDGQLCWCEGKKDFVLHLSSHPEPAFAELSLNFCMDGECDLKSSHLVLKPEAAVSTAAAMAVIVIDFATADCWSFISS